MCAPGNSAVKGLISVHGVIRVYASIKSYCFVITGMWCNMIIAYNMSSIPIAVITLLLDNYC